MSVYSLDSLENEPVSILHVPEASETSYDICNSSINSQNNHVALLASRLENASVRGVAKRDKKLGNVLPKQRPASYLELYRRRFKVAAPVEFPEDCGLSSCTGSKQHHDGDHCLKDLPAVASGENQKSGDRSEMSFYQRLLEQELTFRPYTLSDYRQIRATTSLVLPKSLPPDSNSLLAKREALVRRRSYGDAASAVNRTRISSSSSSKLKPCKNCNTAEVTAKPSSRISKRQSLSPATVSTVRVSSITTRKTVTRISGGSPKKKEKVEVEQPSLHDLRRRHFNEKRMIDQLVKRTLLLA